MCALVAYSIFRLIRYFRYGMARRVTAVPTATSSVSPSPGMLAGSELPVGTLQAVPGSRLARIQAASISVLVFVVANGVLLVVLFGLPALGHVPVIWRLFLAIFANFYLLPFARAAGQKRLKQIQARAVESGNPFGH